MEKIPTPSLDDSNFADDKRECSHKSYDVKAFKVELNFATKIPMSSIAKYQSFSTT